jgi:F0F1-type ATP synthase epsilon subunit
MKHFHVTIRTPDEEILDARDIQELIVNTESGPMTVFAKHASLTGSILFSRLIVKTKDKEDQYMARRGTIFVDNEKNHTVILVLSCEKMTTITFEKLDEYIGYLNSIIESGGDLSSIKLAYLEKEKLAVMEQVAEMKKVK